MNNKPKSNAIQIGEVPDMQQFLTLVYAMRVAQKAYFKARKCSDPAAAQCLERSKQLEQQVDTAVMALRAMNEIPQQPELF